MAVLKILVILSPSILIKLVFMKKPFRKGNIITQKTPVRVM